MALQQQLIDESIPDYSPDVTTTLPPNNSKCLKLNGKVNQWIYLMILI